MDIENIVGVWPNMAINPENGLPYKCDSCIKTHEVDIKDLQVKLDKANEEIAYLRKVCQKQADSFAAIENQNAALRSKLNRIRELAERPQDA